MPSRLVVGGSPKMELQRANGDRHLDRANGVQAKPKRPRAARELSRLNAGGVWRHCCNGRLVSSVQ